jgi:hypothetical protein
MLEGAPLTPAWTATSQHHRHCRRACFGRCGGGRRGEMVVQGVGSSLAAISASEVWFPWTWEAATVRSMSALTSSGPVYSLFAVLA